MANLVTPEATLAAASLFVARAPKDNPNGKKTFYARLLFTAAAMQTPEWKAIEARVMEVGKEAFGAKFPAMWREGAVKSPFRPQVESKGYPAQFACFINTSANEDYAPAVVIGRGAQPLTDTSKVYPGCVVRASVSVRAYGGPGKSYASGISIDLRNVLWVRDGERLKNAVSSAAEDFGGVLPEEEVNDDLNNLVGQAA